MDILCMIGLHKWEKWEQYEWSYLGPWGLSMGIVTLMQRRKCKVCGKMQRELA